MTRTITSGTESSAALVTLLLAFFGDPLYNALIALPSITSMEYGGVASACFGIFGFSMVHWKTKFRPYRTRIRAVLQVIFDSLFLFLFVGIVKKVLFPMDMILLPYVWIWQVWILFLDEAFLLVAMWDWWTGSNYIGRILRFLGRQMLRNLSFPWKSETVAYTP